MIILIVEDSAAVVSVWKRLLSSVGRDFRVADNVEDALREMEKPPHPDLVLLDLTLRDTNAEETLARVEDFRRIHPETVILIITGNPNPSLALLAQKAGADGFQAKPDMSKQDNLLQAVREAFKRGIPAETTDETAKPYERRICLLEKLTGLVT